MRASGRSASDGGCHDSSQAACQFWPQSGDDAIELEIHEPVAEERAHVLRRHISRASSYRIARREGHLFLVTLIASAGPDRRRPRNRLCADSVSTPSRGLLYNLKRWLVSVTPSSQFCIRWSGASPLRLSSRAVWHPVIPRRNLKQKARREPAGATLRPSRLATCSHWRRSSRLPEP